MGGPTRWWSRGGRGTHLPQECIRNPCTRAVIPTGTWRLAAGLVRGQLREWAQSSGLHPGTPPRDSGRQRPCTGERAPPSRAQEATQHSPTTARGQAVRDRGACARGRVSQGQCLRVPRLQPRPPWQVPCRKKGKHPRAERARAWSRGSSPASWGQTPPPSRAVMATEQKGSLTSRLPPVPPQQQLPAHLSKRTTPVQVRASSPHKGIRLARSVQERTLVTTALQQVLFHLKSQRQRTCSQLKSKKKPWKINNKLQMYQIKRVENVGNKNVNWNREKNTRAQWEF